MAAAIYYVHCTILFLQDVRYDSIINFANLQGDFTFELREYPSVKWVCTESQYDMAAEVREFYLIFLENKD